MSGVAGRKINLDDLPPEEAINDADATASAAETGDAADTGGAADSRDANDKHEAADVSSPVHAENATPQNKTLLDSRGTPESPRNSSPKSKYRRSLRKRIKAAHKKLDELLASPRGKKVIESEKERHDWTDDQVVAKLKRSVQQSVIDAYNKKHASRTKASNSTNLDDAPPSADTESSQPDSPQPDGDETSGRQESQFLNAALELMDEQSKTAENMNTLQHEVSQLLEQMEKLKALPPSITGCVAKVNEALDRCTETANVLSRGTGDGGHSVASGWLIKDGGHTLSTDKTRWAIVNPPYMVYYKTVDRSTVKGILFLDRCHIEPTTSGFVLLAIRSGVVLNPLHPDKRNYRFTVPNPADLDWWIQTMRSALDKSRTVQGILRWQQRFQDFTDIADYRHLVEQCLRAPTGSPDSPSPSLMSTPSSSSRSSPVASPFSQSRKSLQVSSSRPSPAASPLASSRKSTGSLRSYASASSLIAAAAAEAEAMEELTNVWSVDLRWLRNFKNDPILSQQKMFDEITAPRIRTPKAAGGHGGLRASTSNAVTDMVQTICRRFEVSWDHRLRPLGLDSTMTQVRKDTPRDMFCIDGDNFERIQGDELVNILVQKLLAFHGTASSMSADPNARAVFSSNKSAMALRFARSIVLGSTRTISGGDAYDAVDLIFRNRDLIILCPLSGRSSRVEIVFERVEASSEPMGGETGDETRSPVRSRRAPSVSRARYSSETDNGTDNVGLRLWPRVVVTSRTFYRLRDCEGDDDVAVAEAIFKRKFLCDGSTSGTISVVLHSATMDVQQSLPSPIGGKPRTRKNSVIL